MSRVAQGTKKYKQLKMAGIGWNKLRITDWMAMAGGVSALVNVLLKVTT